MEIISCWNSRLCSLQELLFVVVGLCSRNIPILSVHLDIVLGTLDVSICYSSVLFKNAMSVTEIIQIHGRYVC